MGTTNSMVNKLGLAISVTLLVGALLLVAGFFRFSPSNYDYTLNFGDAVFSGTSPGWGQAVEYDILEFIGKTYVGDRMGSPAYHVWKYS